MRKFTLSFLALAITLVVMASVAGAQTSGQASARLYWAADFNKWALSNGQAGANVFQFPAALSCITNPYTAGSYAFNTNAPVYINDTATPANSELVTPSSLINTQGICGFSGTTSHTHYNFQVQSGSAGLQEILNWLSKTATYPSAVLLDASFYGQATAIGSTAATLIAAASGGTGINLVDTTQDPWQWYGWNGTAYVKTGFAGNNYGNLVNGQFWGYKNTGVTAIAAPTNGTFTVTANSSGITAATYRPTQTCVDPLGGETLPGSDSATVTTTSSNGNITSTAPTCAAGSVGWEFYLSAASGGAGSEIFYTPTQAGCTTLSNIGVKPSCALTSGSVTSALVTGTGDVPLQASAYAMAIEPQDTVPTPFLKSWPPFVVTGVQTYTDPYVLAQFRFPAGYMNQVGKAVEICGDYVLTPSATGTDAVTVVAGPYFDVSTGTVTTWTSGALTNAAYEAPFCITLTTAVTGASGTFEAHGTMQFSIASTGAFPHAGYTDPNTATIAIGDLTKEISVWFVSTPGTSNVTQGQMRQFTVTPLN